MFISNFACKINSTVNSCVKLRYISNALDIVYGDNDSILLKNYLKILALFFTTR